LRRKQLEVASFVGRQRRAHDVDPSSTTRARAQELEPRRPSDASLGKPAVPKRETMSYMDRSWARDDPVLTIPPNQDYPSAKNVFDRELSVLRGA
jgi:hypothetical protein